MFTYDGGCPFLTAAGFGWIFYAGLSFRHAHYDSPIKIEHVYPCHVTFLLAAPAGKYETIVSHNGVALYSFYLSLCGERCHLLGTVK